MPAKFDPSKTVGVDVIIQLNITGTNGGDWIVTIKDQKLGTQQGLHPSPSLTIRMADTDYVDMINGKLGGERAFMTGKLKFKGSMTLALKLKEIGFM